MKKNVKIITGIILLAAALIASGFYLTRPVTVETFSAAEGTLTENLQLEGTVTLSETEVITAATNGTIMEILCRQGESVQAGEELVFVDDSEYQREIADEIMQLENQKDAMYNQNYMNGLEIKMQQEQLIEAMDAARYEYDLMFGENGTAYHDADIAEWAYKTAEASLAAAKQANDEWNAAKKKNPALYTGNAPFSGNQLAAYSSAVVEASAAWEKAERISSEKSRLYYEGIITAYQTRFDTLTELGKRNAKSASQEKESIQISVDALVRKQTPDKMAAAKGGIVSEVLAEEGSYVTQYQPLIRIYNMEGKKLETWMLTEDACDYQAGDTVTTELPDGTSSEEIITFISPVAEERVSTLGVMENRCKVELTAENVPEQMGPGYEITLQFSKKVAEKTLLLPVSALINENQDVFVYFIDGGKCRKIPVTAGTYSGGMVEITAGISQGMQVVKNPGDYNLKDGMSVKIK